MALAQEAHHLCDGFHTTLIRDITADLEADFTATFEGDRAEDLDYLYSFNKAVAGNFAPTIWGLLTKFDGDWRLVYGVFYIELWCLFPG